VVVNLGMNKDEKGAQHYGEKIIEERQELSETRRKIKERDNLITSILLHASGLEHLPAPNLMK
jgi:hypothetical protein